MLRFVQFFFSWIVFLGGNLSYGAPAPDFSWADWQETKRLYDLGKFEDALQTLQTHPTGNPSHYYYNLGTIYYRLNRLGPSIAYLQKADHIQPQDANTQFNLAQARTKLTRVQRSDLLDSASHEFEQWGDQLKGNPFRIIVGSITLCVSFLWIHAYGTKRNWRKALFHSPSGLGGLIGLAAVLALWGVEFWSQNYPPAICLETQIVRSGPGDHYMELAKALEGSKVRLLGPSSTINQNLPSPHPAEETWNQVRYSPEGVGWVKASGLLVL